MLIDDSAFDPKLIEEKILQIKKSQEKHEKELKQLDNEKRAKELNDIIVPYSNLIYNMYPHNSVTNLNFC